MTSENKQSSGVKAGFQGAHWRRTDLHLHSPGADSFKFPAGLGSENKSEVLTAYVDQLAAQNIEIAAITDYQCIREEWFVPIQEAARQCEITIFPGVELSFNEGKHGLHILAIFPLESDIKAINRVIHALDKTPSNQLVQADGTHRDINCRGDLLQELSNLRTELHCLFILPHPNDSNGIFKTYRPEQAAEFIRTLKPDAIENFTDTAKQRLLSTNEIQVADLQTIAAIESSDPKSITEIGTKMRPNGTLRTTFLKLSKPLNELPKLEALRLVLRDSEILVRVGNVPTASHTQIKSLRVDGTGFIGGLQIDFSSELNVLIGGRGVGKSAVLETIRYVLDIQPYSPEEYREDLVRYALGSGGKATIDLICMINNNIERKYRLERNYGAEETIIFEADTNRQVNLSPSDILGENARPLFFGQKEIYEVTVQEARRLRLLDEIIGDEGNRHEAQINKLTTQLKDNARRILDRNRKLRERERIEHRLAEIEHKIDLYRREGIADKLQEATALVADEQRLEQAKKSVQDAKVAWQEATESLIIEWSDVINELHQGQSSKAALLQETEQIITGLSVAISKLQKKGGKVLDAAQEGLQELLQKWLAAKRPLDESINQIKQQIGNDTLDPDILLRLTREKAQLEPQLRTLDTLQNEVVTLNTEREKLLGSLQQARQEVFQRRQTEAQKITAKLNGRIRIAVTERGQQKAFIDRLVEMVRGSGIYRQWLEKIAKCVARVDGRTIADMIAQEPNRLEIKCNLTIEQANKIHNYFTDEMGRLYDLELAAPEDKVQVYLKLDQKELPLGKLSAGQRATAMLLILLAQESRLLLIDQPEDDLDNRFIYDDIVQLLRQQKDNRQFIMATHNPNIPVLAHAELIVALDATDTQVKITTQGAIDFEPIQEMVKNVMEGGEKAFQLRAQKYGWM
ncbi:PHP N-terminal domain protein [hydrothermal vent metagenome]|uniref:PHP N-terminal domain protein n=1 Tax=hydrothermal vent metagenome TaxID=652676 RepID=A0A3B0VYS4_9ZZZZ